MVQQIDSESLLQLKHTLAIKRHECLFSFTSVQKPCWVGTSALQKRCLRNVRVKASAWPAGRKWCEHQQRLEHRERPPTFNPRLCPHNLKPQNTTVFIVCHRSLPLSHSLSVPFSASISVSSLSAGEFWSAFSVGVKRRTFLRMWPK